MAVVMSTCSVVPVTGASVVDVVDMVVGLLVIKALVVVVVMLIFLPNTVTWTVVVVVLVVVDVFIWSPPKLN